MRRERSPSEDRGRAPGPVWDNPGSQLPGTGVQAGFETESMPIPEPGLD